MLLSPQNKWKSLSIAREQPESKSLSQFFKIIGGALQQSRESSSYIAIKRFFRLDSSATASNQVSRKVFLTSGDLWVLKANKVVLERILFISIVAFVVVVIKMQIIGP